MFLVNSRNKKLPSSFFKGRDILILKFINTNFYIIILEQSWSKFPNIGVIYTIINR